MLRHDKLTLQEGIILEFEKKNPTILFYENLDEIREMKEKRYFNKVIWRELVEQKKYKGGYPYFNRLMNKEFANKSAQASNSVIETEPKNNAEPEKQNAVEKPNPVKSDKKTKQTKGGKHKPKLFLDDLAKKTVKAND